MTWAFYSKPFETIQKYVPNVMLFTDTFLSRCNLIYLKYINFNIKTNESLNDNQVLYKCFS